MATKKIILEFTQQPVNGSAFTYDIYIAGVKITYAGAINSVDISFAAFNNHPYQIGIGATLSDTIDNSVQLMNDIYLFSGSIGAFTASLSYAKVGNTMEITITSSAADNQITFFRMYSSNSNLRFITDTPCQTAFLTNQSIGGANYNALNALNANPYYLRNNTLNTQSIVYIKSVFDIRLARGYNYSLVYQIAGGIALTFDVPASIDVSAITAYFNNNDLFVSIAGADPTLSFRYSIDDITYQSSATFPALAVGTYTVYIEDSLGCKKSVSVTNTGTTNGNVVVPFAEVSESNSIRFVRRVDWGICGNYKNVFNTLSCEEDTPVAPRMFTQLFQACDTNIKTQVKTSYENVEVAAGNTAIVATKIVAYIGMQDKRDCTYYGYNNQLAVLFTSGNTYDYGTANVNGTYQLNGQLPAYGVVGTWVETAYGTLQIANIRLAANGQRSLIFNIPSSIPPTAGTIQAIYNEEDYDIWEFAIDMSAFLNTSFNVGIRFFQTVADPNFPDIIYKSERIQVKTRWERSKELIWRNSDNTDIYFYSGIEMRNRLNFCDINTNLSDGDVEVQKTDVEVVPIDATNYNVVEFEANFLTTGMVRKIKLALKHNYLIIEGVPYSLAENPETERLGKSNMYNLKAKLYEDVNAWNQGTANNQNIFTSVPLIGLLQGDADAEYLRIQ